MNSSKINRMLTRKKSMIKVALAIVTLALSFSFQPAEAQDKWSLERCIGYALDNNIQVKQQRLNAEYSKTTLNQSKSNLYPNLNAGGDQTYSFGRSVDPYSYQFTDERIASNNFYISSSVTLFNGFQAQNTIQQNEFNLMLALQDVEKAKNDIALNIATAYLQILFSDELVNIAQNQLEITKQQIERTQRLVEAGSMAQGNLLEVQAQAASEELQVINTQNQLRLAYLNLTQMLDLKDVPNFAIEKPVFPDLSEQITLPAVDQVFLVAQNLPQIKSRELEMKSSERGVAIARGMQSPKLTLNLNYGTGYSNARKLYSQSILEPQASGAYVDVAGTSYQVFAPSYKTTAKDYAFGNQIRDNGSTSISLRLNIPIFNNYQAQNAISNSRLKMLNSNYNYQTARNQLYKEIQQSYSDATAAFSKFKGSKKALTAMEESFKYTQQKYDVGIVTTVDYNTAKNQLAKTKSDMLQAKYEYIFKKSILDFYAGNPIKL